MTCKHPIYIKCKGQKLAVCVDCGEVMVPLREFICENGHVNTVLLYGDADRNTQEIECGLNQCILMARRVEVSVTAPPKFVEGCGGFYKSSPPENKP